MLPASYRELVKAIEREARDHDKRLLELQTRARKGAAADRAAEPEPERDDPPVDVEDEHGDELDGEGLEDEPEAA